MTKTSTSLYLKPSYGQCRLLGIEELGHDEVAGLLDWAEVHVQVGEGVMLQGGAIGALRVTDPLVNIILGVGKVLTRYEQNLKLIIINRIMQPAGHVFLLDLFDNPFPLFAVYFLSEGLHNNQQSQL